MGKLEHTSNHNLAELETLVNQVKSKLHQQQCAYHNQHIPRVDSLQQFDPRVEAQRQHVQMGFDQTIVTTTQSPPLPISLPSPTTQVARQAMLQQTALCCQKLQDTPHQVHLPTEPAVFSTRSKVIAAIAAPPKSGMHTQSRLMQLTKTSKSKQFVAHAVQSILEKAQIVDVINTWE